MTGTRAHNWTIGVLAGVVAAAALVGGSEFGNVHSSALHPKLVAWISAAVLLVSGVIATRHIASVLGRLVTLRSIAAAGAAVRLIATGIGYIVVVFAVFAVLEVSIDHLLVGAGLAGIVLGIAAQQSLGNVFAGVSAPARETFQGRRPRSDPFRSARWDTRCLGARSQPDLRDGAHR